MATYYVSSIWTTNNSVVSHVNAHLLGDNVVQVAKRFSVVEVIQLMKSNEFFTANWNYSTRRWHRGAKIHAVNENGTVYLRTNHDAKVNDNLDNMLNMFILGH